MIWRWRENKVNLGDKRWLASIRANEWRVTEQISLDSWLTLHLTFCNTNETFALSAPTHYILHGSSQVVRKTNILMFQMIVTLFGSCWSTWWQRRDETDMKKSLEVSLRVSVIIFESLHEFRVSHFDGELNFLHPKSNKRNLDPLSLSCVPLFGPQSSKITIPDVATSLNDRKD